MPRIPEKDLEDWVCENIAEMYPWRGDARVVSRQCRLPSGRVIDVVSTLFPTRDPDFQLISVIEIKAEVVDEAAVIQALRYMGEFQRIEARVDQRLAAKGWERPGRPFRIMDTVLVGPAITDGAQLCIEAVEILRFVQLEVEIRTHHQGYHRQPPDGALVAHVVGPSSDVQGELP